MLLKKEGDNLPPKTSVIQAIVYPSKRCKNVDYPIRRTTLAIKLSLPPTT